MLSKFYILTNNCENSNCTKVIESIYKNFRFTCSLQFIPTIHNFPYNKKREFYNKFNISHQSVCELDEITSRKYPASYHELEYAVNHWNVWNVIQHDISRGLLKDDDSNYFLILDNDISFNHSLSNSLLYYEYILSDIRNNELLHSWDIIYLSYRNSEFRKKNIDMMNVTTRVSVPNDKIHMDCGYLLSMRGLKKLISSEFNKNVQPIAHYFQFLQQESFHTPIRDVMYIYHSICPIFSRHNVDDGQQVVQYNYIPNEIYSFHHLNRIYNFIILVPKNHISKDELYYVHQYAIRYGIITLEVDSVNPIHGIDSLDYNIFYTLFNLYEEVADPEHTLVLYTGKSGVFPNIHPTDLCRIFLSMNKKSVHIEPKIGASIWMVHLQNFHTNGVWSVEQYNTLFMQYMNALYIDELQRLFYYVMDIPPKVDTSPSYNDGIVFRESHTSTPICPPILYTRTNSENEWRLINQLKYYNETILKHYIPVESTSNIITPCPSKYHLMTLGRVVIYIGFTSEYLNKIIDFGFKRWFGMLMVSFSLDKSAISDLKQLYEPSSENYEWTQSRPNVFREIHFYTKDKAITDGLQSQVDKLEYDPSSVSAKCITIMSMHVLLESHLSSMQNYKAFDYLCFVHPLHILNASFLQYMVETQCPVIAPCINGLINRSKTNVGYNEINNDMTAIQTVEMAMVIERKRIGLWSISHVQHTWCIHSSLFKTIYKLIVTEPRVLTEYWECYIMRILRKNRIHIWFTNQYTYGFDLSL